ncbi:hypothetical protein LDENG_00021560 [Lucifuga dentata]|nr:hypothetical protein LDENG_00021560 [Lucifuga dentata]
MHRSQRVRVGRHMSSAISLSTGSPQGCVYDCVPTHPSNSIIKFADDTTMVGLISGGDESAYQNEVEHLSVWCKDNNLILNTTKIKEMIEELQEENNGHVAPVHRWGLCREGLQLSVRGSTWRMT